MILGRSRKKSNTIKGPLGQLTFWGFFFSVLMVIAISLFVDELYARYRRAYVPPKAVQSKVQSALVLLRTSLPEQYPFIINLLQQAGMHVTTTKVQPNNGFVIGNDRSIIQAMTELAENPHRRRIAIQLPNSHWMVLKTHSKVSAWMVASEVIAIFVAVAIVFLLTYLVFFSFTVPLRLIAGATDRLGVDMNAPRLAPVGSAAMRALIRSFNSMQQRMQKLLRDRSQMLAAISHDLRTPITRLQLRAEFIEDKGQYEKTLADLSDMERMIASILAFCKNYTQIEGKSQLDLWSLVESLVDDFQAMGKPVTLHGDDSRLFYFGRVGALRRAINNIIENALKYGEKAAVELTEKEAGVLLLKITDQGPGIPEEDLERVFEPFYRCDTARSPSASGSGLGLAVVSEIVSAHGGRISLINLPEGGLRVEIVLYQDKD
jgi:signal transduction histidine kinase